MASTLQRIFQQNFVALANNHRLPPHWIRAGHKLSRCRSAALGGHVQACPAGHVERVWYNSCRHRSCPQCNGLQMAQWLARQRERLLDCPHHHIIFTIPHDFNLLWIHNTATLMEILFQCARECLLEMLCDERRLGTAEPGFMLALHTWGRSLSLHPHLHCLITDGGLSDDGWLRPRGSCFLPARALMAKFRGKFITMARRALHQGGLTLPSQTSLSQLQTCLNRLGRTKWNVHLRERYGHANGVAQYLARYVRGGPMHDGQVVALSGQRIGFRYTPHDDSGTTCRSSVMTLTAPAFLRRYLQHVQQPRKHTVRSYGLYAPRKTERLNLARATFQQPAIAAVAPLSWQAYYARHPALRAVHACPVCGEAFSSVRRIAPQRGPPRVSTSKAPAHA
jgi:hypothetical protein